VALVLNYYRYKLDKGMMTIDEVPQPYQDMLRAEGYGASEGA
jgi:hypothetical protein